MSIESELLPGVAGETEAFRTALSAELESFLSGQRRILTDISAESEPLVDAIGALTRGGKKLRAQLCYWGWRGAGGAAEDPGVVLAGLALELFQSAALIHDDIIDRSDTRRGAPSVHRSFQQRHAAAGWHLDGESFGQAAGILAGDMCLSFSEEVLTSVGASAAHGTSARAIFNRMRTEVMAGQYLDVFEEVVGAEFEPQTAVDRARNVLRYKSAKYSTVHPLTLGAGLAGADEALLAQLRRFALPLGEAFQLRDDVLGVFGDPETTGKPAGDDLREGKRTVLIGHTLATCSEAERALLVDSLGHPELDAEGVETLRRIIADSGALAATEELITELSTQAFEALSTLPVDELTRLALTSLARAAIERHA